MYFDNLMKYNVFKDKFTKTAIYNLLYYYILYRTTFF